MSTQTKRTLSGIAALVALAALLVWAVRAPLKPGTPAVAAEPAQPEPAPLDAGAESRTEPLAPATSAERAAASSEASAPAAPAQVTRILVVERGTGAPVEGAEVRWAHTSATVVVHHPARPLFMGDFEALVGSASPALTDAAGIVRVAERVNPGIVCARRGELYGDRLVYDFNAEPIRIEIDRDISFRIQVVDERGTPVAGVPVGVRCSSAQPVQGDAYTAETEGEQGIARVAHLQKHLVMYKPPWSVAVHVSTLGYENAFVPVDLEHLPAGPVKLVLGATGTIVLLLHDAGGEKVLPMAVNLAAASDVQKDGNLAWGARTFEASRIELGRAEFRCVPLGLDVYVDAMTETQNARTRGKGPAFAGETVTFDLDLGPGMPLIVGRLVDEEAQPIAGCDAQLEIEGRSTGGAGAHSYMPIRTDAEGRFRLRLPLAAGDELSGSLAIRPFCVGHGEGEEARLTLDARIHGGVNDIGDFVVNAPHVLASGRVVDERGEPVPKAGVGGDELAIVKGKETWQATTRLGGNSDAGGEFVVKGLPLTGRFRLRAQREGYSLDGAVEMIPGQTGIVLKMTRASRVQGRALLDEVGAAATVWAWVVRTDLTPEQREMMFLPDRARVKPDGAFDLPAVRPGRVDLAFRVDGRKEPVFVVSGLVLRPGETVVDGRLDAVDLRGLLEAPATPAVTSPR